MVPQLQRSNLTDAVIREIRQMILSGEVKPGELLPPQPELARRFGVSVNTVREAVGGLALTGVLDPYPGRGTMVSPDALHRLQMAGLFKLEVEELGGIQIYEARRLLEVELTGLAAERAFADDLDRIEVALKKMRQTVADERSFSKADNAFHMAIARAAGNQLLEQFYRLVMTMLDHVMYQLMSIHEARISGINVQQDILDAIRAQDVARARQKAIVLVDEWGKLILTEMIVGAEDGGNGEDPGLPAYLRG